MPDIPDYPELHYSHKAKPLLSELTGNHQSGTDYTITFGHVLAQAHAPTDIKVFTRVILHILKLMDDGSNCFVVAVDARGACIPFTEGWTSLLSNLEGANISYESHDVPTTKINDCSCAKIAALYRA